MLHPPTRSKADIRMLTRSALCAALIAICSWISIPAAVPFTMQTFAVFLTCELMGGKGLIPVVLYLLLGAAGIPVFSGFRGGIGTLLGPTGGYLMGFAGIAAVMQVWEKALKGRLLPLGMGLGLAICYAFGTAWFMTVCSRNGNPVGMAQALGWCVLPYIVPDLIKIVLAHLICRRVRAALGSDI
ncbi:MAG: biotin transporter BioY [Clostridia bacterium]|nr:biotin transporter BioY [Clostridia bacterium]